MKQSGRNWNCVLSDFLYEIGFKKSKVDPCLFIYSKESDKTIFVIVWVDDIIVSGSSMKAVESIKDALKKRFKMKDLGNLSWFLGIEFQVKDSGIFMSQSRYIKSILLKYGMSESNPRGTPCESKLITYDDEVNNTPEDVKLYR